MLLAEIGLGYENPASGNRTSYPGGRGAGRGLRVVNDFRALWQEDLSCAYCADVTFARPGPQPVRAGRR